MDLIMKTQINMGPHYSVGSGLKTGIFNLETYRPAVANFIQVISK